MPNGPLFSDDPALEARLVARWQEWTRPPVLPPGLVSPAPGVILDCTPRPLYEHEWLRDTLEAQRREMETQARELGLARYIVAGAPQERPTEAPAKACNGHQAKRRRARQQDTPEVLVAEEVAALLHMHRNDVYKLRLPELPHVPGHKHRYYRSGVLRWMEEQANGEARQR